MEGLELGSGMLSSVIYKLDMSAYIEVASLRSEARSSAVQGDWFVWFFGFNPRAGHFV